MNSESVSATHTVSERSPTWNFCECNSGDRRARGTSCLEHLLFTKGRRTAEGATLTVGLVLHPQASRSNGQTKIFRLWSYSQDLSRGKPRSSLPSPPIRLTHLHTAQCSPSTTGLYTGVDTCQQWCLSHTATQLAVLPPASYTGCSERALDPHKSGKRGDRLPRGIKCRKQCKGLRCLATQGSP